MTNFNSLSKDNPDQIGITPIEACGMTNFSSLSEDNPDQIGITPIEACGMTNFSSLSNLAVVMKPENYLEKATLGLARSAVEKYLNGGILLELPENLPPKLSGEKAGVFVSIHTRGGSLCGCIGTFLPTQKNIAVEITKNAIAAATKDPRFPPVTLAQLPNLHISVDILSKPKPIKNLSRHRPDLYGLLIQSKNDHRAGLLLPHLDGVDTTEKQVLITCRKAGIDHRTELKNCKLYSFTVERYKE